jgi:hypothetical protein
VVSLGRLEGLDGSCGHCWVMMKVGISMRWKHCFTNRCVNIVLFVGHYTYQNRTHDGCDKGPLGDFVFGDALHYRASISKVQVSLSFIGCTCQW